LLMIVVMLQILVSVLAVHAEPRLCAGIGQAESFVVYRCGDHPDPFLSCSEVPDDLVRSQYDDDLSGPEDHCCHPVPVPVPVDQLSVKSHRVGSGKEYVAGELLLPDGHAFLVGESGSAVIKDRVSLAGKFFLYSKGLHGPGTAEAH